MVFVPILNRGVLCTGLCTGTVDSGRNGIGFKTLQGTPIKVISPPTEANILETKAKI